jgi:hypothetical protein
METALSTLELTAFWGAIGYRQMRVSTLVLVLALVGGALAVGCVEDVRFNPSGWLAIIDEPELEFWVAPEFTLKCDAQSDSNAVVIDGGAYLDTMLVTRNRCDGTGEILQNPPTERYKSRWRATTELKFVVDCSPIEVTPITAIDGGTELRLDVGTVNFQTMDGGVVCPQP